MMKNLFSKIREHWCKTTCRVIEWVHSTAFSRQTQPTMSCFPQMVSWRPDMTFIAEESASMPDEAKTPLYHITTYSYMLMAVLALVFNGLLIATLVKGVFVFRKIIFFFFSAQLAIANAVSAFANVLTTFPVILWMDKESGQKYTTLVLTVFGVFLIHFTSQLIPFTLLSIAAHRFIIFVKPGCSVFKGKSLWFILSITWLFCFCIALVLTIFGCSFRYDTDLHYFQHVCTQISGAEAATWLSLILFIEQVGFPIADLLVYWVICGYLIRNFRSGRGYKAEALLMIPSICMFIGYEISSLSMLYSYNTPVSISFAYSLKRITSLADMSAASIAPIVLFITNADVRYFLRLVLLCRPSRRSTSITCLVAPTPTKSFNRPISRPASH